MIPGTNRYHSTRLFKVLFVSLSTILSVALYSLENGEIQQTETGQQQIVNQVAQALIIEYENYSEYNPLERMILKMGKTAFIESVETWRNNWEIIETMPIELHPRLQHMSDTGVEAMDKERSDEFTRLLVKLTRLAYRNLDLYRIAVTDYFKVTLPVPVTTDVIDSAVNNPVFYEKKVAMYNEEDIIKEQISIYLKSDELRYKLGTYRLAFNFFDRIRKQIIEKDMERMKNQIEQEL
jgi:hypothetical protein